MNHVFFIWFLASHLLTAASLRVVTWNILDGLEEPGTESFDSALAILQRINADVILLQEVRGSDRNGSPSSLDQLAAALSLAEVFIPEAGSFDNNNRSVILSRYPLRDTGSIRSPTGSRDLTRAHAFATVDHPDTDKDPLVVTLHLKCCFEVDDFFRRAVEMERLRLFLQAQGIDGNSPVIVGGDFNLIGSAISYSELPPGLPSTYSLGPDISFPVSYSPDPDDSFSSIPLMALDATQQNGTSRNTFRGGGSVLDYLLASPALTMTTPPSEVFNAARDGVNIGLPKSGTPINDATGVAASDHFPVFADFTLDDSPSAYSVIGMASSVTESFDGFTGQVAPMNWSSTGASWLGMDQGSTVGLRALPGGGIGVLSDTPVTLTARLINSSSETLTALALSFHPGQWFSPQGGANDRWVVELIADGQTRTLSELEFTAGSDAERLRSQIEQLEISPNEEFQVRFRLQPGTSFTSPAPGFINEFHYDNFRNDTGEFVEVVLPPGSATDLTSYELVLYDGTNALPYGTFPLSSFTEGPVNASGHRLFFREIVGIENGSPDGIGLRQGETLIDLISYEGSFEIDGLLSRDVGVSQGSQTPEGEDSIALTGAGGLRDEFSWGIATGPHSKGTPNPGQVFTTPTPQAQGLSLHDFTVSALLDLDTNGFADGDQDNDFDGQSNKLEFLAGTNPDLGTSFFQTTLVGNQLSFPTILRRNYQLESSNDLRLWTPGIVIPGSGNIELLSLPTPQFRFHRLRLSRTE